MADAWRIKKYYKKRVLIETGRVLDPQFDDSLVCITGAHFELLRNLMQYLHRRSTFVSEYQEGYYVAPSNEEWDSLQSIIGDLEEVLMGCADITQLLEDILVQVTCVCQKMNDAVSLMLDVPGYSPSLSPIVDGYLTGGELQEADDYGADTVVEAKRCAVAQLVFWQAWEFTTEVMQPVAETSVDTLLPVVMVTLAAACGSTVLGIPVGVLLAVLWYLIELSVDGSLWDVQNAIWAYQKELVCAVWAGLATDYKEASSAAKAIIDNMAGMSVMDKAALKILFAPWVIHLAALAWENQTAWALSLVEANYCDDCTWWFQKIYEFPPCPQDWTGGFPCTDQGRLGLGNAQEALSPSFALPSIADDVNFDIVLGWTSCFGSGWTVGYLIVQYQDVALVWHDVCSITYSTTVDAGQPQTKQSFQLDKTIPRNVLRIRCLAQAGQTETDPWPFEVFYINVIAVPDV